MTRKITGTTPAQSWRWAAALLVSCSSEAQDAGFGLDGAATDAAALAEQDCSAVLAPRAAFPQCSGATCDQVQREADREVRWRLVLQIDSRPGENERELSPSEKVHQQGCVLAALQHQGLAPALADSIVADNADILVEASYSEIESVVHSRAIYAVQLECVENDCEGCATLNEQECRADALCRPVQASAVDANYSCQAPRYAGCYRADAGCTGSLVSARGTDGQCWLFYDGCLPPGYQATNSQDPACGYATFDNAPECGQ